MYMYDEKYKFLNSKILIPYLIVVMIIARRCGKQNNKYVSNSSIKTVQIWAYFNSLFFLEC